MAETAGNLADGGAEDPVVRLSTGHLPTDDLVRAAGRQTIYVALDSLNEVAWSPSTG